MPSLRTLRDDLTDESVRVAILIGLATVPVTVVSSWESVTDEVVVLGGSVSGGALLLAGLLVGYYYHGREADVRRAGIWTGLAGSLGTILIFGANSVTTLAAASWPWSAAVAVLTPVTIGFGVGFTVFVTAIVAMGTDWVLTRLDRDRRTGESGETDGETRVDGVLKWRLVIAGYAVLAPVALGYTLWIRPEGDAGVLLAVLLLVPVVFLSVATLVALFVDTTAPRGARTEWLPSVWLYVGGPIGAGAFVSLVAAGYGLDFPQGYGQYGYLVALWLAAAGYLVNGRRHGAIGRRRTNAS
ncbi:hypothetical protein ACLI4Z_10605 [Natrialbaceae archaeon A-arb3/5]